MSGTLLIEGVSYISSKRASDITGYSQDYIGQLARAGKILGRRVDGLWYVLEESLMMHKTTSDAYVPVPPASKGKNPTAQKEDMSTVSFDGKTFVSAARAAKITSYHQDYIGQLARSGKILSKQVGRRWYVDIEKLKEHKREKDALLAAVQVESVGIQKPSTISSNNLQKEVSPADEVGVHYTYKKDERPLNPILQSESPQKPIDNVQIIQPPIERKIPINVVRSAHSERQLKDEKSPKVDRQVSSRIPRISIFLKIFPVIGILSLVFFAYNFSLAGVTISALKMSNFQKFDISFVGSIEEVKGIAETVFLKELKYTRE